MVVNKFLFKVPLKRNLVGSLGIGLVVGGASYFYDKLSRYVDNDEYGEKNKEDESKLNKSKSKKSNKAAASKLQEEQGNVKDDKNLLNDKK